MQRILAVLRRYLVAGTWVYFTLLFGWVAASLLTGDRYVPVAVANLIAPYLFLPLVAVLPVALWTARRELWLGLAVGTALFGWFWGGLYLPRNALSETGAPTLTVMTFNVLGHHTEVEPILEVLRAEDVDLVLLQEVNLVMAEALEAEFAERYPYQILDPQPGVSGMATLSKYPLRPNGESLPLRWVGDPQLLELDWNGQELTVVNFHMIPPGLMSADVLRYNFRFRESQALALGEYVLFAGLEGPVIAGGDANASPFSDAYDWLTFFLVDAWAEAGRGMGHTFPGSAISGSSRPRVLGWSVPRWLSRIDYIFHSADLETVTARMAQIDGVSDHRGVIAELRLRRNADLALGR